MHLTRQWLTKANHDFQAARLAFGASPALRDIATFHSQQAAEKALKGFLTWHDVPFGRTHDLTDLVQRCETVEESLSSLRPHAEMLTGFAVDACYPGGSPEPTVEITEEAMHRAYETMSAVLLRLPEEAHP